MTKKSRRGVRTSRHRYDDDTGKHEAKSKFLIAHPEQNRQSNVKHQDLRLRKDNDLALEKVKPK